jgi:hypothetical protein
MRAPVDCNLALIQPVAPFVQGIGRQTQSCSAFADAHSAPVHRLDMHRPERLRAAVAHVCTHAIAPLLAPLQSYLTAPHGASRGAIPLIFRKLARSSARCWSQRVNVFSQVDADGNSRLAKHRCAATPRCESTSARAWPCYLKCFEPIGESPLQQRTRNGTTAHSGKVVQESNVYRRP